MWKLFSLPAVSKNLSKRKFNIPGIVNAHVHPNIIPVSHRPRYFSKLHEYFAKPPSKPTPSWKRLAMNIQDDGADSVYLNRLRAVHDPEQHIESLEDELREEMAQALGRTGSKCDYLFYLMEKEGQKCEEVLMNCASVEQEKQQAVHAYNLAREEAIQARAELIIHRQSVGLVWRNQKIVEEHYPIPGKRTPP